MLGRAEIESQLPELNGNVYRVWVWAASGLPAPLTVPQALQQAMALQSASLPPRTIAQALRQFAERVQDYVQESGNRALDVYLDLDTQLQQSACLTFDLPLPGRLAFLQTLLDSARFYGLVTLLPDSALLFLPGGRADPPALGKRLAQSLAQLHEECEAGFPASAMEFAHDLCQRLRPLLRQAGFELSGPVSDQAAFVFFRSLEAQRQQLIFAVQRGRKGFCVQGRVEIVSAQVQQVRQQLAWPAQASTCFFSLMLFLGYRWRYEFEETGQIERFVTVLAEQLLPLLQSAQTLSGLHQLLNGEAYPLLQEEFRRGQPLTCLLVARLAGDSAYAHREAALCQQLEDWRHAQFLPSATARFLQYEQAEQAFRARLYRQHQSLHTDNAGACYAEAQDQAWQATWAQALQQLRQVSAIPQRPWQKALHVLRHAWRAPGKPQ